MIFNKIVKTIALVSLLAGLKQPASAKVDANLESIVSGKPNTSFFRPNLWYALPGGINGYSFFELYHDHEYYGKTTLSKKITDNIDVMARVIHGSAFDTRFGLGASVKLAKTKDFTVKVFTIPYFFDSNIRYLREKGVAGYFVSKKLPLGVTVSSFGEIKLNARNGMEWGYGELNLEKAVTKALSFSYAPALYVRDSGRVLPRLNHKISGKYSF